MTNTLDESPKERYGSPNARGGPDYQLVYAKSAMTVMFDILDGTNNETAKGKWPGAGSLNPFVVRVTV